MTLAITPHMTSSPHLQECADAGRTSKKPPEGGFFIEVPGCSAP